MQLTKEINGSIDRNSSIKEKFYRRIGVEIMMIYELERPDIDCIIDCCEKLEAEEKLKVLYFGEKANLILYIHKDVDYCRATDEFNLVTCSTYKNGKIVDSTDDIHVTDGSLYRELDRIYHNDFRKFI